jgi:outer membrane protein assembly factor BamB
LKWKRFLGERIEVEMQPLVVENLVYIGLMNGKLYALDRETGTTSWVYDAGMGIANTPTVAQVKINALFSLEQRAGKYSVWMLKLARNAGYIKPTDQSYPPPAFMIIRSMWQLRSLFLCAGRLNWSVQMEI